MASISTNVIWLLLDFMLIYLGLKMLYKSPVGAGARPNVEVFGLLKESGEQEKTLTSTERTYNLHLCFPAFQKSSEPKWRTERVKISQHWLKGPHGIKHTVCMVTPVIEDWSLAHNIRNMENWSRFPSDVGHWFCLIYGNSFLQAERSSEV